MTISSRDKQVTFHTSIHLLQNEFAYFRWLLFRACVALWLYRCVSVIGSEQSLETGLRQEQYVDFESINGINATRPLDLKLFEVDAGLNSRKTIQWNGLEPKKVRKSVVPLPGALRPHIIMILTDDQGFANVGYHNPENIFTPVVDSVSEQGVRLERHYTAMWCGPSRLSLMTGRLPHHTEGRPQMPRGFTSVASKLQQLNYSTHQVGKW